MIVDENAQDFAPVVKNRYGYLNRHVLFGDDPECSVGNIGFPVSADAPVPLSPGEILHIKFRTMGVGDPRLALFVGDDDAFDIGTVLCQTVKMGAGFLAIPVPDGLEQKRPGCVGLHRLDDLLEMFPENDGEKVRPCPVLLQSLFSCTLTVLVTEVKGSARKEEKDRGDDEIETNTTGEPGV